MRTQDTIRAAMVTDKFQELAWASSFCLYLLANEQTGDWQLIEPSHVPAEAARSYSERGLGFAGIFGVVDGKPRSELAMPLDDVTLQAAVDEFVQRWARSLTHPRWCAPLAAGVN